MDERADRIYWSNLCKSFDIPLQLVNRLDDIEYPEDYKIVVLDETGEIDLKDFKHPDKAAYVFGYSGLVGVQNHVKADYVVRVNTPYNKSIFGISIAPIVLYDRMSKDV